MSSLSIALLLAFWVCGNKCIVCFSWGNALSLSLSLTLSVKKFVRQEVVREREVSVCVCVHQISIFLEQIYWTRWTKKLILRKKSTTNRHWFTEKVPFTAPVVYSHNSVRKIIKGSFRRLFANASKRRKYLKRCRNQKMFLNCFPNFSHFLIWAWPFWPLLLSLWDHQAQGLNRTEFCAVKWQWRHICFN